MKRSTLGLWFISLALFVSALLIYAAPAYAQTSLEVVGSGETGANACYIETDPNPIDGSSASWISEDDQYVMYCVENYVKIDQYLGGGILGDNLYFGDTTSTCNATSIVAGVSWFAGSGASPYPDPITSGCYVPPDPPDIDIGGATSTIEQTQQNLSTAFFVFFISFLGVVWLLRKH